MLTAWVPTPWSKVWPLIDIGLAVTAWLVCGLPQPCCILDRSRDESQTVWAAWTGKERAVMNTGRRRSRIGGGWSCNPSIYPEKRLGLLDFHQGEWGVGS